MPTGTVKDEGDPGQMKGIRLGRILPDGSKSLIPFDNYRRLKLNAKVIYVVDNVGGYAFALNVKNVKIKQKQAD